MNIMHIKLHQFIYIMKIFHRSHKLLFQVDTIQYIFDALRNEKKEEAVYVCEAFLRIPKKKNEPQYYELIKDPIDMLKIQQKIKTDVYNELDEFCADVQLLVENAKQYYAKVR